MNHGRNFGLVASVTLVACGGVQDTPEGALSIIGGRPVNEVAPSARIRASTVALVTPSHLRNGRTHCTGTLVAPTVVLTAAHCLASPALSGLDVWFGVGEAYVLFGDRVSEQASKVRVKHAIIHPEFDFWSIGSRNPERPPHDIGLVFLNEKAPSGFTPVAVYDGDLTPGRPLWLAGFGMTRGEIWDDSGTLRAVSVPLSQVRAPSLRIETNTRGQGHCNGDSGGPAYIEKNGQWEVVGVVSDGVDFLFTCTGEGWMTDARAYAAWISSYVR